MLLLVFIYLSITAFIGLSIYRFYKYARMPLHGRWELYPVPRETGERGRYGMIEPDWLPLTGQERFFVPGHRRRIYRS